VAAALVWFGRAAEAGFLRSVVNYALLLERQVRLQQGGSSVQLLQPALQQYHKALQLLQEADKARASRPKCGPEGDSSSAAAAAAAAAAASSHAALLASVQAEEASARIRDTVAQRSAAIEAELLQGGLLPQAQEGAAAAGPFFLGTDFQELHFGSVSERDAAFELIKQQTQQGLPLDFIGRHTVASSSTEKGS
jgi:hypothetical protein